MADLNDNITNISNKVDILYKENNNNYTKIIVSGIIITIIIYFGYNLFSNYDGHSIISDHITKNTKTIDDNMHSTSKALVKYENNNIIHLLKILSNIQTNNTDTIVETNKKIVELRFIQGNISVEQQKNTDSLISRLHMNILKYMSDNVEAKLQALSKKLDILGIKNDKIMERLYPEVKNLNNNLFNNDKIDLSKITFKENERK